jgi:hypothetical protein
LIAGPGRFAVGRLLALPGFPRSRCPMLVLE